MSNIKSAYTYNIEMHQGKKFLVIIDQFNETPGDMIKTVTNNIENVVKEICAIEAIDPVQHFIIYKDTDGTWDGWDHLTESFIGLGQQSRSDAMDKFLSKLS